MSVEPTAKTWIATKGCKKVELNNNPVFTIEQQLNIAIINSRQW